MSNILHITGDLVNFALISIGRELLSVYIKKMKKWKYFEIEELIWEREIGKCYCNWIVHVP